MKVVYLNVYNNKEPETLEIEDDLKVFYKLIDCDTVDMLTREIERNPFTIICDDEGLFVLNPIMSAISKTTDERLVGNLIITGMPDDDGELVGLTDGEAQNIMNRIKQVYLIDKENNRIDLDGYKLILD